MKSPVQLSVFLLAVLLSACEIGTINLGGDPVGPDDPGRADSWSCAAVTEIPEAECEVLTALYNRTGGDNWNDNSGWLETNTPCSWFGVFCFGEQVDRLDLRSNGLAGPIPPELRNLSNLTALLLNLNQLTGSIPPELGNLSNLTGLGLRNNQLTGTIPPELGSLSNLTRVSFSNNQLTGPIPPELGNLSNLNELFLNNNQLTGTIPPELGNLSNLKELWLIADQLTGPIPPELGNLSNLTRLFLNNNQLTGPIPPELGNLTNLNRFFLHTNRLEGLVPFPVAELGGAVQSIGICRFESNPGLFMPDSQDYRNADLDGDGFICGLPLSTPSPEPIVSGL